MRLNSVSSIGVLPFIEGSLGDGTSGLVASSRVDRMMKCTLRVSLLKVVTRTAVDLRHLAAVALWVLMNINDRGMTMPRQEWYLTLCIQHHDVEKTIQGLLL